MYQVKFGTWQLCTGHKCQMLLNIFHGLAACVKHWILFLRWSFSTARNLYRSCKTKWVHVTKYFGRNIIIKPALIIDWNNISIQVIVPLNQLFHPSWHDQNGEPSWTNYKLISRKSSNMKGDLRNTSPNHTGSRSLLQSYDQFGVFEIFLESDAAYSYIPKKVQCLPHLLLKSSSAALWPAV